MTLIKVIKQKYKVKKLEELKDIQLSKYHPNSEIYEEIQDISNWKDMIEHLREWGGM